MKLIIPENYKAKLDSYDTQKAISKIHQLFEEQLCLQLGLSRVSAPLFLEASTGLNDDLNGVERPVDFDIKEDGRHCQVVQSLAKWKRQALKDYNFYVGRGLYTDMNAIRRDEELDNVHSIYVDQWDWEKVITKETRTEETLRETVKAVYDALRVTEKFVSNKYNYVECFLPETISFITSQELEDKYPNLSPKQREYEITKLKGAVFIEQIGGRLKSGEKHDGRSPDYDDWITETGDGHRGLNGDLLVWNSVLQNSFELSSMGIRVNPESLKLQLAERGCQDREQLPFHKRLLDGNMALTMGGGIGQSRMCMFFLKKAHIGEIQVSMWSDEDRAECKKHGINLL